MYQVSVSQFCIRIFIKTVKSVVRFNMHHTLFVSYCKTKNVSSNISLLDFLNTILYSWWLHFAFFKLQQGGLQGGAVSMSQLSCCVCKKSHLYIFDYDALKLRIIILRCCTCVDIITRGKGNIFYFDLNKKLYLSTKANQTTHKKALILCIS